MKVLPMDQPWASLVVLGAKRVETRPRPTPRSLKGRVAVHANKKRDFMHMVPEPPFADHLPDELPFGCIVGTVEIVRSVTITSDVAAWQEEHRPVEFAFGDYTPGRFGWVLRNPVKFEIPVPFKAHQGWPDVDDGIIQLASKVKVA